MVLPHDTKCIHVRYISLLSIINLVDFCVKAFLPVAPTNWSVWIQIKYLVIMRKRSTNSQQYSRISLFLPLESLIGSHSQFIVWLVRSLWVLNFVKYDDENAFLVHWVNYIFWRVKSIQVVYHTFSNFEVYVRVRARKFCSCWQHINFALSFNFAMKKRAKRKKERELNAYQKKNNWNRGEK